MKGIRKISKAIMVAVFVGACGMLSVANAAIIGITPDSLEGNFVAGSTEPDLGLPLLYKMNVGGPEEGPYTSSYDTSFFNEPTDPMDATISYISGPVIGFEFDPLYLIVKDGKFGNYYFNLRNLDSNVTIDGSGVTSPYSWNGTDTLQLTGFWPNQGAISHVSIVGTGTPVPEPATMLLLGFGLIGLAVAGRKNFRK